MLNKPLWLKGLSIDQLESMYQKQPEANNIRGYTEDGTLCGSFPTSISGITRINIILFTFL
jgi:hypothetical protein